MSLDLKDIISLAITVLTCGITIGVAKQSLKQCAKDIEGLQDRIKKVEDTYNILTQLSTDMKWMKEGLNEIKEKLK